MNRHLQEIVYRHVHRNVGKTFKDIFPNVSMGMCTGMWRGMCRGICVEAHTCVQTFTPTFAYACVGLRVQACGRHMYKKCATDMLKDKCVDTHADMCTGMLTFFYGNVSGHTQGPVHGHGYRHAEIGGLLFFFTGKGGGCLRAKS